MTDETLSPGQRTLLEALKRLEPLQLGSAEPALAFRPLRFSTGPSSGFDLESAAGFPSGEKRENGKKGEREKESESAGSAAGAQPQRTPDSTGPGNETAAVPPPTPGVVEVAAAVNRGELDPLEVADLTLRRIEALNPRLNALVTTTPERARVDARVVAEVLEAGERPRPLAGVPLVHKDIICTEGIRTTAGSELLAAYVPDADAAVVARLANAGTLLVGKSSTHEFASGTTGAVSYFGPTHNPWDSSRVAGGSSSGSGAALAAGLVPAATGSDTGGSIRIPAACCGVVGLKPTYGRVSRVGVIPFAWSLDHVGPMARSVADVAALLTAISGHDPLDPGSADEPGADYGATTTEGLSGVRFALPSFQFLELARADVADAVREAGKLLEELGAERVDVDLPDELALVGPAAVAIFLGEAGALHARTLSEAPQAYQPETLAFLSLASHVSGHIYLQAQRLRAKLSAGLATVFQRTDLLVTPTLPITAPSFETRMVEGPRGKTDVRAALTLFTRPFNLTGLPALSLPCGFDAGGLPIGLQLVGRPFDEATVVRAGHAYEQATDWHRRQPAGFAQEG